MKVAEPNLKDYCYYPELFIVPSDFCSKNWDDFLSNKNVKGWTKNLFYSNFKIKFLRMILCETETENKWKQSMHGT